MHVAINYSILTRWKDSLCYLWKFVQRVHKLSRAEKQADWSSTWKRGSHSTSSSYPPRCEKSLKSLCSSFLSDKEKSVGNKISHLNDFLIDNKSIKGNRTEQQCSEQYKRLLPARFTQPLAVYGPALPFRRIDSNMK